MGDYIRHPNNPSVPLQVSTNDDYRNDKRTWSTIGKPTIINIAFINGTANQRAKVKKYARGWLKVLGGGITFKWVEGIHGDVRIAFSNPKANVDAKATIGLRGDPIQDLSWSQIGKDALGPTYLPETTHLNDIGDSDPSVPNKYEQIIVEHEFGHILGYQFAPNADNKIPPNPANWIQSIPENKWIEPINSAKDNEKLEDWRKNLTVKLSEKDEKGQEIVLTSWNKWMDYVQEQTAGYLKKTFGMGKTGDLVDARKVWAKIIKEPIIDYRFLSNSVLAFDWRNTITANDAAVALGDYPFEVQAITFGIQDAFDRSLVGLKRDDLVLYAIGADNIIYRNTRVIFKSNATSHAESAWTGWEDLNSEIPIIDILAHPDIKPISFVALDFSDRLEFFVATKKVGLFKKDDDKFPLLLHNALMKADGKWKLGEWQKFCHISKEKGLRLMDTDYGRTKGGPKLEPATILKAIEVDGGANVFFITKDKVLGTIFRKAGEVELPTKYHPVSGGSDVIAITSARIGPPTITNPPRIVALTNTGSKYDISLSSPKQSTLNWTLTSEGTVHEGGISIVRLATGMAIDTQHILGIGSDGIGKDGQLHQILNKDGWQSWDDGINQMKADKNMFEKPEPTKFVSVSVGVVASNNQEDNYLICFAVSESGKLFISKVDDEGNWNNWIAPKEDEPPKPTKWVQIQKDIENIKRVTTKRTRCGDLVVFLFHEKDGQNLLSGFTLNHQAFKDSKSQAVWWDPQSEEKLEELEKERLKKLKN